MKKTRKKQGSHQEKSTSSPVASHNHASLFPWLVKEQEKKITVTSGRKCYGSFQKLNRPGLLAKMLLEYSHWKMAKHLNKYVLHWKMKGTSFNRIIFQLAVSVRGTKEKGSGLLPTHTKMSGGQTKENPTPNQTGGTMLLGAVRMGMVPTPVATIRGPASGRESNGKYTISKKTGKKFGITLATWIKMFPTPQARDWKGEDSNQKSKRFSQKTELNSFVKMNPTPTNSMRTIQDYEQAKYHSSQRPEYSKLYPTPTANEDAADKPTGKMQKMLGNHPKIRESGPGSLNPNWVEGLMGFPIGYTEIQED